MDRGTLVGLLLERSTNVPIHSANICDSIWLYCGIYRNCDGRSNRETHIMGRSMSPYLSWAEIIYYITFYSEYICIRVDIYASCQ
jgi:hypothetical protein